MTYDDPDGRELVIPSSSGSHLMPLTDPVTHTATAPPRSSNGTTPTRTTSFTARELMAMSFPPPRWAVDGIIPEGLSLLAGAPKLGKSWLALHLCAAIAAGGPALGKVPVTQGSTLYLALEDVPRRLQDRLGKLLDGEPTPDGLHIETEWPKFGDGGGGKLLAQRMDGIPDLRLVVVDVLKRIRPDEAGTKSIYDRDYDVGQQLKHLADRHGVALVVTHHDRKAEADDFLDKVSGSTGLTGAADTILGLRRSRGHADAELHMTGRDIEEDVKALSFHAPTGTWTLLDRPASDYAVSDQRRAILDAVRAEPGIGPKRIAEVSNVAYDTVKHLVRRMAGDQLATDGDGHYRPVHSIHPVHHHDGHGEQSEQSERRSAGVPVLHLTAPKNRASGERDHRSLEDGGKE